MIEFYRKTVVYQKGFFFCLYLWCSFFLLGCAGHKILITDIQEKTTLINKINYNCRKIKDLSGHINLDIKIGDKRIIQKGYFFYKTPDLLKINFMGWFGVPRAVFLMNKGIKIYFYGKGIICNIEGGEKTSFLNLGQKVLLDGFEIIDQTRKNYIFYKNNKKIWVDKRKLIIKKIELFNDAGQTLSKIDFKIFKKTDKILVPHKIRIQIFDWQQLRREFPWFAETIENQEAEKLDILIYLKKVVVNKGLKEEIFNLSPTTLQKTEKKSYSGL
ncbi:hypothetical protein KAI68_08550 [bacterium]|nr:hypothetical protein [bacterium]